ncbi:MAG: tetratricopeptide repeat protein [Candidatus Melainabacteria bacterium]|nr:tetratricopeptide repeat protein [Candidatus Melainabacteria bacterium]
MLLARNNSKITITLSLILGVACLMLQGLIVFAASGDDEISAAKQAEREGKIQEAETKYHEALEIFKNSNRKLPMSFAYDSLGDLNLRQNKLSKAAEFYSKCVANLKETLSRGTDDEGKPFTDESTKLIQKDLGLAMLALGSTYTRQEKYNEAKTSLFEALNTIKKTFGPIHDCVGVALSAIGDLKFAQGLHVEAAQYYRQALAIRKKYHAQNDPNLRILNQNYAAVQKILRSKEPKQSSEGNTSHNQVFIGFVINFSYSLSTLSNSISAMRLQFCCP